MKIWAVYDADKMALVYASPDETKAVTALRSEYAARFGYNEDHVTHLSVDDIEETGYYRLFGPVKVDM